MSFKNLSEEFKASLRLSKALGGVQRLSKAFQRLLEGIKGSQRQFKKVLRIFKDLRQYEGSQRRFKGDSIIPGLSTR